SGQFSARLRVRTRLCVDATASTEMKNTIISSAYNWRLTSVVEHEWCLRPDRIRSVRVQPTTGTGRLVATNHVLLLLDGFGLSSWTRS
ncbi:hypothetical protein PROFUN_15834, partial [Planoprotostelium fungivorum]